MKPGVASVVCALLALLLAGSCADNARSYGTALEIDASAAAPFTLGVVEFDDQGRAFDPGQEIALFDHMADAAQRMPLAIVTFVHGWQHNARADDGNVKQFRQLLTAIARFEAQQPTARRRAVIGVYAGWRGRTITVPYLGEFERAGRQPDGRLRPGWRRTLPSGAVLTDIGNGRYDPANPFWVVRAHPSIILDHNDILGPVFVDVVAQLYGDVDRLKHPSICKPSQ